MSEQLATTARESLTDRRLYKFRSMSDDTQIQRLRDIVVGHRIHFSRPSELNDPIEGKPIYALGEWDAEAYRLMFAEWAWQAQKKHIQNPPPRDVFLKWVLDQPRHVHEQLVASICSENHSEIDHKWRVLSLSAAPTHDLMWSHYADGHKGVALVLDASRGEFALAFKVTYIAERIPMDITTQNLKEILCATLLSKRVAWEYEQEFRCIAPEPPEPDSYRLEAEFLNFAPSRLLGIVFGAKTAPDSEAQIVEWVAERQSVLGLWKANINSAGGVDITPYDS